MLTSGAIKLLSAEADQAVIDAQMQTDALKLLLRSGSQTNRSRRSCKKKAVLKSMLTKH
jgi:hypothetical protein